MQTELSKIKVYLAGICSLIVTAGVARFSYTSLLPIMQAETGLTEVASGWLATSNYLGYMCGVILAANLKNPNHKFILYRVYLLLTIASTAAMVLTTDTLIWSVLRFMAGTCTSGGLIIASSLLLKWLVENNHRAELGIHFSGVGISIIFTALLVEYLLSLSLNWQHQWLGFSIMALIFSIPAWLWIPRPDSGLSATNGGIVKDNPPGRKYTLIMLAAYFCAGYGYVVSTTFIVDIIEDTPNLQGQGQLAFILIGLAAIPAALLWDLVARKIGYLKSLLLAYSIQIIGIILPAISDHIAIMVLSTLLYGGTVVACVSLVLTMAGKFFPSNPAKFMGKMTLSYGVAQIIAPMCTSILLQRFGNYNSGLYLSAIVMCVGVLMIVQLLKLERLNSQVAI